MPRDGKSRFQLSGTELPKFLKNLRTEAEMKTELVANALGIAPSSYNDYENGRYNQIPFKRLKKLLEIFYEEQMSLAHISDRTLDMFVCRMLQEKIFRVLNKETIKNELWILALYFEYTEISINQYISEPSLVLGKLNDLYHTTDWKMLFQELNNKDKLFPKKSYSDENTIYIDSPQNSDAEYFPIMRIRYSLDEDKIEERAEMASENRIKTKDLFTLIFNGEKLRGADNNNAFKKTCVFFHDTHIPLIYNSLNIMTFPKVEDLDLSRGTDLLIDMKKLLESHEDSGYYIIEQFKQNYLRCGIDLLNVIAFDFSFIMQLTKEKQAKYRKKLIETTAEFKNQELIQ